MSNYKEIRISVRELAEYAYSSGDLDARFVGMSKALLGARLHQKLQGLRKDEAAEDGGSYQKEIGISRSVSYRDLTFIIAGRIDGIEEGNRGVILEEIKTTGIPLSDIDGDTWPVHWAQAKCYAYMYAVEYGKEVSVVRLTYYNTESKEQKVFEKLAVPEELEEHFNSLLEKYCSWAYDMYEWGRLRDNTIESLDFPYPEYRRNQRKLAVAVYKTVAESKRIFIQAPTGTGKTMSALFPAIKALGEGKGERIFYLTAKTITRQVALDAICRMQDKGLRIKSIVLTAKDKICFKEETGCDPDYCEYARGYFDKVNEAVKNIFTREDVITREIVERYAEEYRICPFELSLDLSYWVDCIICDYNYVFDPRASLKRFFLDKENDFILLVDEAHNLVDRAREMFSAELVKKPFLELKRKMKNTAPAISKAADMINSQLLSIKKKLEDRNCCIDIGELKELHTALRDFTTRGEAWLGGNHGANGYNELLELYFEVTAFLRIYELYDERYTVYVELLRNDVKLKLFCLDPSRLLGEVTEKARASIFYSATLTPLQYFKDILGGTVQDYNMRLPSPFEASNLCLVIAENVSTKYLNREKSFSKVAEYIMEVSGSKEGNYFAFFPSYKYMNEVYMIFTEKYPDIGTIVQQPSMQEEDKESFLSRFSAEPESSLVGFAVMGGMFSEGIDLAGDRLIGAVIVGVGLPQVCFERDVIMDYFRKSNNMGFEYAYVYPGMNKVLQAAGRVIRSEEDRGVVLLVDERFGTGRYSSMFPEEWQHNMRVKSPGELQQLLCKFWKPQV
ncbi:MAG: ATP-dependent DNA helicase [Pseudomonadota bacterium]